MECRGSNRTFWSWFFLRPTHSRGSGASRKHSFDLIGKLVVALYMVGVDAFSDLIDQGALQHRFEQAAIGAATFSERLAKRCIAIVGHRLYSLPA